MNAGARRPRASAHFNKGSVAVAFLFSAPGAREESAGRPVAGVTGENLEFALVHLHRRRPDLFPSTGRYSYRITNAFPRPLAKSRGDRSSEATLREVTASANVARVKRELRGCALVVLCGRRAQELARALAGPGTIFIQASHTGNRALATRWPAVARGASPPARRKARARRWAEELLRNLRQHPVA